MKRLLFSILIVAALVGAVFTPASMVMAASATRSLPPSVAAGANFDVGINTADYGAFGQVVETLPPGFSYVSSTLSAAAVDVDGQVVKFTLLEGDPAFTYTVAASSTADTYTFSGILKDEDKAESTLGGDTEIIVPATRSLPSSVDTGEDFSVSISTFDYGAFGQVVETLPPGFSYVSSTLDEAAVDEDGQEVTFTLLEGDTPFTYTVTASSTADTYAFSGILKDEDKAEYDVGGDAQITVSAPSSPSRSSGGGGGQTYYTKTDLFGLVKSIRIGSDGEILTTIEATSEDGMLAITIPKGTIALDKDGDRLDSLEAAVDESPPDPPEDAHIIGLAYDFRPAGATFDPPITFIWSYDPEALPQGVAEDLIIAYYDEGAEWVEVDCVVDTENDTVTGSVEHFTTFALIGTVPVPPTPPVEEEEVVPEEEEVVPEEEEVVPPEEEEVVPPEEPVERPAAFTVSQLSISPAEVEVGETVTVSVMVANTGDLSGSYEVALKIDGVAVATGDVTLKGGASQTVTFTTSRDVAGTYAISVDGRQGTLVVRTPPTNWPLISGIIAGVLVLGLVIFFWIRRRALQR